MLLKHNAGSIMYELDTKVDESLFPLRLYL